MRVLEALGVGVLAIGCHKADPPGTAGSGASVGSSSPIGPTQLSVKADWILTANNASIDDVAAASNGSFVVAGVAHRQSVFAGSALDARLVDHLFVASVSGNGSVAWVRQTDNQADSVRLALAADQSIWVVGRDPVSGKSFISKLSSTGEQLGDFSLPRLDLSAVATLEGDIIVAGRAHGSYDLAGSSTNCGGSGALVARLHLDGKAVWLTCAATAADFKPGPNDETRVDALVASPTDVALCGQFSADLSLGGTTVTPNGTDLFVASVSPSNGAPKWLQSHGGPAQQSCHSLAILKDSVLVGAEGGAELLDKPHGRSEHVEPVILSLRPDGGRNWGWVDDGHIGGTREVASVGHDRIFAIDDDDRGATLIELQPTPSNGSVALLSRTTLHGPTAPLREAFLRVESATVVNETTLAIAGVAFRPRAPNGETDVVADHAFVAKLSVH